MGEQPCTPGTITHPHHQRQSNQRALSPLPMAKIQPLPAASSPAPPSSTDEGQQVYTVWMKSLVFNSNGCTVYGADGGVAFRVDNYSRRRKLFAGELLLMDGRGAPLLALRPQVRTHALVD